MTYEVDVSISLGTAKTGLTDLRAQLLTSAGVNSGDPISTGFTEVGQGMYLWHYDDLAEDGAIIAKFYSNAAPSTILALGAIDTKSYVTTTVAEIADGVWDEARSGHSSAGTFGEGVTSVQGSVTGSVASVTGAVGSVAANGITATSLATDAINAASVKADAVTKIQAGLATPTNITAGTITTATNVTTVNGLAAGVITAASIATDAIDADALADGAITAATFAAGAITAAVIATDAIDADAIADGAIDTDALSSDIATAVWVTYSPRTLTQTAASVAAVVAGSALTIQRGDTTTISLTGLGNISARTKLWFAVKDNSADIDTASILFIEETAGLTVVNAAAYTTIAHGAISVTNETTGALTITINAAVTAQLIPDMPYQWDIQMLTASGVTTLTYGDARVTADVTRAVA